MNVIAADILKCLRCTQSLVSNRAFHATGVNMDILWRQRRRLPKNRSSEGPLTDLPDFSYLDGRPSPLGARQKWRLDQQKQIASKIVQGIHEVDFAKKLYQDKLQATESKRQHILNAKLKPKGVLLNEQQPKKKAVLANDQRPKKSSHKQPKHQE